jgi:short-subunit dehydrogenase
MAEPRPLAAITGASSGIGATFARRLAREGYDLLLVARRKERLEQLAAELPTASEVLVADLADPADLDAVAARLAAEPRLDLLINNAGYGTVGLFWEAGSQIEMHKLHVIATATLTRAALQGMAERRRGAIINVASVAAFMQSRFNVSYCSTKAWMNSFSEGLWLEMKSAGLPIRIQSLCPGFTYSEFHDVMGVDRGRIPRSWWLSAEYVVGESLKALERDQPLVVPHWRYKFIVGLFTWLPRPIRRAILLKMGNRNREPLNPPSARPGSSEARPPR